MLNVEILDLKKLKTKLLYAYQEMTDRQYRHLLNRQQEAETIAIGVTFDQRPIGLALASANLLLDLGGPLRYATGEWHTLFLEREHLDSSLLEKIIDLLASEAKKKACTVLSFALSESAPEYQALVSVFKAKGWEGPRLFMRRYYFKVQEFHPQWFDHLLKCPYAEGYAPFKWKDLKASEDKKLRLLDENEAFPAIVTPFRKADGAIERINSLGLRYQGEVVGWMITHRIKPDTVRYSALYIGKEHQHLGMAMRLLADSIHLQQKSSIPLSMLELNLHLIDPKWFRLVEKKIAPFAYRIEQLQEYWKTLRQPIPDLDA